MTGNVVLLLLLLAAVNAVLWYASRPDPADRTRRLHTELHATDRAIGREHAAARQAMNEAAGQAWRNRFE